MYYNTGSKVGTSFFETAANHLLLLAVETASAREIGAVTAKSWDDEKKGLQTRCIEAAIQTKRSVRNRHRKKL